MDKDIVIHRFWAGFGVPAYDENSVPDEQRNVFPRITYDIVQGDTFDQVAMSGSVWDRSTSWDGVYDVFNQINDSLSNGGVILPCDGGGLWIKKASPWAQRMGDESDDSVRRIFMNISVEFITNN